MINTTNNIASRGAGQVVLVAMLGMLLTAPTASANWEFVPTVSLGVSYSDNINLAPLGSEESDQALEVIPGFTARYQGPRFEADINYSLLALDYRDNNDLDETYHRLAATASAQLVQETFFLDAGAAIRQQVIDTTAPIPTGSIAGSGNLSDEYTTYLSPRWHIRMGDRAQADLRYAAGDVRYEDDTLNDSTQQAFAAVVESIAQPDRFYWAAKYRQSRVDPDGQDEIRFEQATVEVGVPLSGRMRLILLGGEEHNDFLLADGSNAPDDSFWLAGVRSQRAERYEFELLVGERVFGNTASLRWLQHGRQWSTEARYTEEYITYAETRLDIDPGAPASILPGPGLGTVAPEVYLRERVQLSATLERPKTTLNVRVYDETRDYQTVTGQEELQGADLSLIWRASSLTTFTLSGGRQENRLLGTGVTDKIDLAALGVERRLGRRTTGSFILRRTEQSSELASREYDENSAALRVSFTF